MTKNNFIKYYWFQMLHVEVLVQFLPRFRWIPNTEPCFYNVNDGCGNIVYSNIFKLKKQILSNVLNIYQKSSIVEKS